MRFNELRKYISVIDKVSICMRESLQYENFYYMEQVPEKYDEYYVYGIGLIESEFNIADAAPIEVNGNEVGKNKFLSKCIEIMLSEKPREEFTDECTLNEYAYVNTRYHD